MNSDERPVSIEQMPDGFHQTLGELKRYIFEAQQRAAFATNAELVKMYHRIGIVILSRQANEGWGKGQFVGYQRSSEKRSLRPAASLSRI